MTEQSTVAVVGTGRIAKERHLPAWASCPDARLVAVCDLDENAAAAAADSHEGAIAYTDFQAMLEEVRPNIVDICTPPGSHATLAIQALEGGAHVLMEKPMALSVGECDAILDAAAEHDRHTSVIQNMLHYPPVMKLYDDVQAGRLGELQGVHILIANNREKYAAKDDWVHELPGGMLGETGPHVVYLAQAFIGPARIVQASARRHCDYEWSKYDDFSLTIHGDDVTATARVVHSSNHWDTILEVWGSEGKVRVDLQAMTEVHHRRPDRRNFTVAGSVLRGATEQVLSLARTTGMVLTRRYVGAHHTQIHEFADAIQTGRTPRVSGEEGREAVRTMRMLVDQLE